jgi:endonuclease YncB( thermonuclease family)
MVLLKIGKKSLVLAIAGILLVLLGFLLGRIKLTPTPSLPVPTETPTLSPILEIFRVTRVIDGDTIEIESSTSSGQEARQKVRYLGIDTPETVDPRIGEDEKHR